MNLHPTESSRDNRPPHPPVLREAAFTLLELLVVMGIIGIIAGMALPAIRNMSKPKNMSVAARQLLDDLSYARNLALSTRGTVFVLMAPTNVYQFTNFFGSYTSNQTRVLTNMVPLQYRGYALYQARSVGDQPGQSHARYLTEWKGLPEKIFFPHGAYSNLVYNSNTFNRSSFNFPTVDSPTWVLHYVAFSPQGQLVYLDGSGNEQPLNNDAILPLTEGSFLTAKNPDGTYPVTAADVVETPPGRHLIVTNRVRVNWVTGRARIEKPEL